MAKRMTDLQSEIAGVCVDEARRDTSVASVAMDETDMLFPDFPGLLHNPLENIAPHNIGGVVSVKVNCHSNAS
jgi:hypothetical protein